MSARDNHLNTHEITDNQIQVNFSYDKLFAYMFTHNISRNQLAKTIGVSKNTIKRMEQKQPVHLDIIKRLYQYYGLTINQILDIEYE